MTGVCGAHSTGSDWAALGFCGTLNSGQEAGMKAAGLGRYDFKKVGGPLGMAGA